MRLLFFIPCLLFLLPGALPAQNAFLDLYHPFNKSLIELRTDSLFIRTQDGKTGVLERAIGYRYPEEEGRLPEWREIRKDVKKRQIRSITQRSEQQGSLNLIETETLDSTTKKTVKRRAFISQSETGRIDSVWYALWSGSEWKPVQKTVFIYFNKSLLQQRTELRWNDASGTWQNESNYRLAYKNNKVVERRYEVWKDSSWTPTNRYVYDYRRGETQPASSVRYAGPEGKLTPVDSLVTWYDDKAYRDSSLTFLWNAVSRTWGKAARSVLKEPDQQIAGKGESYYPEGRDTWKEKERTVYQPGDLTFTDEPREEISRLFDPVAGEWKDKRKKNIVYRPLDDTHIYGYIRIDELDDSLQQWVEVLYAEAWFTVQPQKPVFDTLQERNRQFAFSYFCGLPNPYVRNMTLTFPENDASGDYELKVVNEEGRLVFHQKYDDSGTGFIDAPLQPGFYLVSVSRGNTLLCTQKLVVQQ